MNNTFFNNEPKTPLVLLNVSIVFIIIKIIRFLLAANHSAAFLFQDQ